MKIIMFNCLSCLAKGLKRLMTVLSSRMVIVLLQCRGFTYVIDKDQIHLPKTVPAIPYCFLPVMMCKLLQCYLFSF